MEGAQLNITGNGGVRARSAARWRRWLSIAIASLIGVVTGGPAVNAGSLILNWSAPTTNADGTPLTDLSGYRVYLGTTPPTCPSGSFHSIASPTPTPAPSDSVASLIVGLAGGTTYFALVTAVDIVGNESTCSISTSGVAREDFAVTPTTATSFGSLPVGTTATRTFTVQNVGQASLSGTINVSTPFSVVSGGSWSLAAGASQVVTIRFAPTAVNTFATNVNVTAGDDTISRAVSGVGTAAPDALTVARNGTGSGTVVSTPAGISCGTDCSEAVTPGTQLTLTATPAAGSTFEGWSGACTGTGGCTVIVNAATAVTATFALVPVTPRSRKPAWGRGR
jgi:hypothetical protein